MSIRVPPLVVLLSACVLVYVLAKHYPIVAVAGEASKMVGVLMILFGALISAYSVILFKKYSTTLNPINLNNSSTLVMTGIYQFSRNPNYLGMLIMLTGYAVFNGALVGIVPILLFALFINQFQIPPEEKSLTTLFGDQYIQYKQRVRRWI